MSFPVVLDLSPFLANPKRFKNLIHPFLRFHPYSFIFSRVIPKITSVWVKVAPPPVAFLRESQCYSYLFRLSQIYICLFLISFQNDWIRYAAVGYVSTCAKVMNIADVYCSLMPAVKPYLKQPIIQLENEVCFVRNILNFFLKATLVFLVIHVH